MLSDSSHFVSSLRLGFLLVAISSCTQDPAVDLEANKQVLRDFYAALDQQDYDRLDGLWGDQALTFAVGTDVGYDKEIMMEFVRANYASFPDYTHVIDEMYAEEDLVAVRLTYHATHHGEYEGIPATGNLVTYGGANFFTVRDGQIQEIWGVEDKLGLMQQLGMGLAPADPRGTEK